MSLLLSASPLASSDAGSALLPIISLVFFVALFLGISAWLLWSRRDRWAKDASIPLHDAPVEPRGATTASLGREDLR